MLTYADVCDASDFAGRALCDHAKEVCPYFPTNALKIHHNFPDPSKLIGTDTEIHAEFTRVRQLIKDFCFEFVQAHSS
jgi:arsenate reductase